MQIMSDDIICVYGRIKKGYLVGRKGKFLLSNPSNYPEYKFGYWLIEQCSNGWVVWKVLFV